jgi:acetyl-CoA carboxylase biotin carboxyl carrier protein
MKERIDSLASLVEEFSLDQATLSGKGWKVSLGRTLSQSAPLVGAAEMADAPSRPAPRREKKAAVAAPAGKPITSPMMGIYYASPSPGAENFVKEGQVVQPGDVVGLIEAMKVFNEIPSPFTGRVLKVLVESGQLVQPGDVLVLVE